MAEKSDIPGDVRVGFRVIPDRADATVAAILHADYPGSVTWLTAAKLVALIEGAYRERQEAKREAIQARIELASAMRQI